MKIILSPFCISKMWGKAFGCCLKAQKVFFEKNHHRIYLFDFEHKNIALTNVKQIIVKDLSVEENVKKAFSEIEPSKEKIFYLFSTIGGFTGGKKIWETETGDFDRMINMNLRTSFLISKYFSKLVKESHSGSICLTSAYTGLIVEPGKAVYGTSKAALIHLIKSMAEEEKEINLSAKCNCSIYYRYGRQPFKRVLSCAPAMYDELWTAGKGMYKLEPAVAVGGEVIIYAPHLDLVSHVHGKYIYEVGYHILSYFLDDWDRFKHIPLSVLAHSTHVRGSGVIQNGVEQPNVPVTLASKISPDDCARLNLGYLDPVAINPNEWQNRENEGILYVAKAGEVLYRQIID